MILADTSAMVDYLRGRETPAARKFAEVLDMGLPFGLAVFTVTELLQGAKSQTDFDHLKAYLETQRLYAPKDSVESYAAAAQIYLQCRRRGLTVRGTIDCLIAQIAIEHELMLLHGDRDFEAIVQVVELRFY